LFLQKPFFPEFAGSKTPRKTSQKTTQKRPENLTVKHPNVFPFIQAWKRQVWNKVT